MTRPPFTDAHACLPSRGPSISLLKDKGYTDVSKGVERSAVDWSVANRWVKHSVSVHGVVLCEPKQALGDILAWKDREEAVLHKYFGMASDVLSLRVMELETFAGGVAVDVHSDLRGNSIKTRHDAAFISADLTQQALSSNRSWAQLFRAWNVQAGHGNGNGKVPILFVVEPIVALIKQKAFRTVVVQASKFMSLLDAKISHLGTQAGIASLQALLKAATACPPRPTYEPVDLRNIANIANHLRRWAPQILVPAAGDDGGDAADDDDEADVVAQNRMQLKRCLIQLDGLAESFGRSQLCERREGGGWQFHGAAMLQCIRLMMQVRNRSKIAEVVDKALRVAIPTLAESCLSALSMAGHIPDGSTLSRAQPCLDAALLLLHKAMLDIGKWALYVWADSSPQLSYNFLISTMLAIAEDKLVQALDAAALLARTKYTPDLEERDAEEVLKTRADCLKVLAECTHIINNMPQCLAVGGTSLMHKVRVILHIFWMMGGPDRLASVIRRAASIVSFTTDLGTEMGLSDVVAPSVRAALPPWIYPAAHGARVQADDGDDGAERWMTNHRFSVLSSQGCLSLHVYRVVLPPWHPHSNSTLPPLFSCCSLRSGDGRPPGSREMSSSRSMSRFDFLEVTMVLASTRSSKRSACSPTPSSSQASCTFATILSSAWIAIWRFGMNGFLVYRLL